jgi:enoyl-[acyl-carrier-protein] reductase (NADH)
MLDGKLGKLAKEIAEETAAGLNIEMDDATDMKSVFNNLIKNPGKLMGLVKSVGR